MSLLYIFHFFFAPNGVQEIASLSYFFEAAHAGFIGKMS